MSYFFHCLFFALLIARCRLFCAVYIAGYNLHIVECSAHIVKCSSVQIAGYNVHIVECSAHIVKCSVHIFRASASRARLRIFIAGQRVSRLRIPSILTWELLFNKQASGSHSIPSQRVSKLRITSILNWERRIALVWFHWGFLWLTLRSHYHKQVEFEFVAKPKG